MQGATDGVIADLVANSILAQDGDDHVRLRKLVSRAFTPRADDRPLRRLHPAGPQSREVGCQQVGDSGPDVP